MKILFLILAIVHAAYGQYAASASGSTTAASEINSKPAIQVSSSAASGNCTAGKDFWINTTANTLQYCKATNSWSAVWLAPTVSTTTTQALFATATSGAGQYRAIVSGDIPTLNQNTTGTAANADAVDGLGEAATATASKLAARDANGNLLAVGFLDNVTSTATDGSSTITLTVASSQTQKSTGTTTLIYQLPVTSTLALNQKFYFNNLSTGAVIVNSSGGNAVIILAGGTSAVVKCILTSGTSAASWSVAYAGMLITSGKLITGTNTITLSGTDGTVWTGPSTSFSVARIDAAQTFTGTQTFGALVATTLNGNTFTTGTGVLTIGAGKTLTASNSITFAGTDSTMMTLPAVSATIPRIVASGATAVDFASTATGACATVVTASATGVASTDAIVFNANASVKAVTGFVPASTGGFTVAAYPTTNTINFEGCNWTTGTVDPGSITINWAVFRQ